MLICYQINSARLIENKKQQQNNDIVADQNHLAFGLMFVIINQIINK